MTTYCRETTINKTSYLQVFQGEAEKKQGVHSSGGCSTLFSLPPIKNIEGFDHHIIKKFVIRAGISLLFRGDHSNKLVSLGCVNQAHRSL